MISHSSGLIFLRRYPTSDICLRDSDTHWPLRSVEGDSAIGAAWAHEDGPSPAIGDKFESGNV